MNYLKIWNLLIIITFLKQNITDFSDLYFCDKLHIHKKWLNHKGFFSFLFTFILLFMYFLTSLTRFKHDLQTEFKELTPLFHSSSEIYKLYGHLNFKREREYTFCSNYVVTFLETQAFVRDCNFYCCFSLYILTQP